jgi:hypothetical protein
MMPSREQIERVAYERWERRGRYHGDDLEDWIAAEMDLVFDLNYKIITEYQLEEKQKRVIGGAQRPRCRFCEQSAPQAAFSRVQPAVPELVGNMTLGTREICDECADRFGGSIDRDFAQFWESLDGLRSGRGSFRELRAPTAISIPAYKALIRMGLTIMPEEELSSFTDAIEWISNPDHHFDSKLFCGVGCLVYQAHLPYPAAWTSLARRSSDDTPLPYMLFFLASGRLILQVNLPLCSRDEDLDGEEAHMPERSFSTGVGADLCGSTCLALPLNAAAEPSRSRRFRLFW